MMKGQDRLPGGEDVLDGKILVRTAEGPSIRIGAFFGEVLVIHCLRYYG